MWRKSNAHADAAGVEVALIEGVVTVRNAKDPYGGVLLFGPEEWARFTAGVREGEFDLSRLAETAEGPSERTPGECQAAGR